MQELVDRLQNKVTNIFLPYHHKHRHCQNQHHKDHDEITNHQPPHQVKGYKRQIEEAEEIAALNLAKFRKVKNNMN